MSKLVYKKVTNELGKVLNNEFTTSFRSGYLSVNGTIVPEYFKEFGDDILNMRVRQDDVWICSFPKCGTTWTQEMVWLIANDLDYEGAKVALPERFPFLEHTALFDYRDISRKFPDFEVPKFVTNSVEFINNIQSPRFIKTHLPYSLLPEQILNNAEHPKIIYTCRDAKDCLISYYHHCKLMEGYSGSFDDFYKLFLGDGVCFAPFWAHVLGFWENRSRKNILFLHYEDMKANLPSVIREVSSFLNKDYDEEKVQKLAKHLSFESMKNNPAVNYEPVSEMNRKYGLINANGNFMRSGKVGDFKSYMSEEQVENIDTWSKALLAGSGLEMK